MYLHFAIILVLIILFGLLLVLEYWRKKHVSIIEIIIAVVIVFLLSWILKPMIDGKPQRSETKQSHD